MAIKITEIELTNPALSLAGIDPTQYSSIQCLVRLRGTPLGYCWFQIIGNKLPTSAEISMEIVHQLQWPLLQTTLARDLITPANLTPLPKISVAIVTRNRAESLLHTLQSLAKLDYPAEKLEILIIDNAPDDDSTAKVVARFPQFSYFTEPRPGLSWGRNRAIAEAKAEIIAFTDDDVEVDANWVRAIGQCFTNPAVMCVTGLVAPAERDTDYQNLFEELGGFGKGFSRLYHSAALQKAWLFYLTGVGAFGTGANMAFRKKVLVQLGGFDEALGAGSPAHVGEDMDMFFRLLKAGNLLVYEPQALVWHHHRRTYEELKQQLQGSIYAVYTKIVWQDKELRWKTLGMSIFLFYIDRLNMIIKYRGPSRKFMLQRALNVFREPLNYYRSIKNRREIIERYGQIELRMECESS